jgi:rRNA biogenesis protein RRP5
LGLQAKLSTGMSSVQDSDDGDEASADDVESESEDEAEPDDVESEDETSDDEASEASEDKVPEEPDTNSGDDATEHADSDDTSDSDHEESSSEDESVQEVTAEEDEKRVRQREDALADPTVALMTDADYQREVIATPNNSVSWIKYMAFQLSIGEVDKAREVVQKALKTISFRNESEKQNVWVASLNLEKQYGTKATLMQMFERAILYNDPKPIYTQMVDIHKRSADHSTVEDLYKVMVRKFKNSPEVWCAYGAFQLERGEGAEAKKILERSLSVLDRSKRKWAELEQAIGRIAASPSRLLCACRCVCDKQVWRKRVQAGQQGARAYIFRERDRERCSPC